MPVTPTRLPGPGPGPGVLATLVARSSEEKGGETRPHKVFRERPLPELQLEQDGTLLPARQLDDGAPERSD